MKKLYNTHTATKPVLIITIHNKQAAKNLNDKMFVFWLFYIQRNIIKSKGLWTEVDINVWMHKKNKNKVRDISQSQSIA